MQYLLPWLRLQLTPGLGRIGLFRLIEHFGSPEQAITASERQWAGIPGLRATLKHDLPGENAPIVQQACRTLQTLQVRLHTYWDEDYPGGLRQIADPPALFYCLGEMPPGPAVAIVGTRRATPYGTRITEELAAGLAARGVVIVSGMARGIDSAAHWGAINANGKTVAVLGTGIDRIYPPENRELYHRIAGQGCLISEYPPGSEPLAGHFPGRNRIISALSRATLVVEASRNSGSLITAEFALEQGRDVMAVPGGIDRESSYAPNQLIKQGAHPVTELDDILSVLGLAAHTPVSPKLPEKNPIALSAEEGSLLSCLDLTPRHSDDLVGESGLTAMEVSVILLHLELQGYAEKLPGGRYIRGRRAI